MSADRPFTLLRGADVVLPTGTSRQEVLVAGGRVVALGTDLGDSVSSRLLVVHDLSGLTLAPGFVDAHVHFLGGGGGDGFHSRAPELQLTDLTLNAITTAVGAPGIDMVSRNMEGLLAKAHGLRAEGLSAFIYTGGFHRPHANLTGSPWRDCYLVPTVVGVKVAVGESRAPALPARDLIDLARELAWVERATGRGAVLHIHLGRGQDGSEVLRQAVPAFPNPARAVITHSNYSRENIDTAIELASVGAVLDMTSMLAPHRGRANTVRAAEAIQTLLEAGASASQITMSTDGNGSAPSLIEGSWEPYQTNLDSLLDEVRELARSQPLSLALAVVTQNPARSLGLASRKGRIAEGADADLIALDSSLQLVEVYASGSLLVHEGKAVVRGRFENKKRADQPS